MKHVTHHQFYLLDIKTLALDDERRKVRTFWLGDLSLEQQVHKLRCKDAYLRELALGRDQIRRPYGFLFRPLRSFVD